MRRLIAAGLLALALASPASAVTHRYVSVSGAGAHDGTLGNEWTVVEANAQLNWGSDNVVCHVGAGAHAFTLHPTNGYLNGFRLIIIGPGGAGDSSAIVPGIILETPGITVRQLKSTSDAQFTGTASDVLHYARGDSITDCVINGGMHFYGAKKCHGYRNTRISGQVTTQAQNGCRAYSGSGPAGCYDAAINRNTDSCSVVGNFIPMPNVVLTNQDVRAFSFWAWTQNMVVDSNLVTFSTSYSSGTNSPALLWYINSHVRQKDNVFRYQTTFGPGSVGTNYMIYIRDSSDVTSLRNRYEVVGGGRVVAEFGASGSFSSTGMVGSSFHDDVFKLTGDFLIQASPRNLNFWNCVFASRFGIPFSTTCGAGCSIDGFHAVHCTYWTGSGGQQWSSTNNTTATITNGRLSNSIFAGRLPNACSSGGANFFVRQTPQGSDSSIFWTYGGSASNAVDRNGIGTCSAVGPGTEWCNSGGNDCHSLYTNFTPTDTAWATLDLHPLAGSPAFSSSFLNGYAGAYAAAGAGDVTPPGAVNDLSVPTTGGTSVNLRWTAPGDDGTDGTATVYDVRYSTSPITSGNFASATEATGEPNPSVAGSIETMTVTGLSSGTTYYFALTASDEVPNVSGVSNSPSGTPTSGILGTPSVQFYAGYRSIGVRAFVQGDGDSDCVAQIFYRRFNIGADYDSATKCFRRPGGGGYDGLVYRCDSTTTYQILVEFTDPDGGSTTVEDTVSTRGNEPGITGPLFYVKKTGNDSNNGTSEALADLTISGGISDLVALGAAGAGGAVVIVANGDSSNWHEQVVISSGSASPAHPYTLMAKAGSGRVILDGSIGRTFTWLPVLLTDSIYMAAYTGDDSTSLLFLGYGHKVHRVNTFTELEQNQGGVTEAWYTHGDSIYMKTTDGATPGNSTLFRVGKIDRLLWIQKPYWRVVGLEVRFAGGPAGLGYGILLSGGASENGCFFDSLLVYGTQREGLYGNANGNGTGVDSIRIEDSAFEGRGQFEWSYEACKSRECEHDAITGSGRAWAITRVSTTGYFNGLGCQGETADTTDGADWEVWNCSIKKNTDDGIEFDTVFGINARFWINVEDWNTSSCLSPNPVYNGGGPIWFLYNQCSRTIRGVKSGGLSGATMAIYQNTFASAGSGGSANYAVGGYFARQHWRNNVVLGSGDNAIRQLYTNGTTSGIPDTTGQFLNDFNYDMLDSTSGARLMRWNGTNYSLVSMRQALGWEKNGVHGRAAFVDSANRDYRLTAASAARNMGQRIAGINTEIPGRPYNTYSGSAPDAGANEFDEERPAAVNDLVMLDTGDGTVRFSWTSVGDDSLVGIPDHYVLFYTLGPCPTSIDQEEAEVTVSGLTAGDKVIGTIVGLENDVEIFAAVYAYDEQGNVSAISNCAAATPSGTPTVRAPFQLRPLGGGPRHHTRRR